MSAPIALRRRLVLVGLGVAFAIAVVGLAELALRLAGFGGSAELVRPLDLPPELAATPPGQRLFEIDPALAEIYFARAGPGGAAFVGGHRRELVTLPKSAGTLRIVLCGASTIEGFPMPRQLTAARFLEETLRELVPGRRVEVLNLGVTALASFPIRKIAIEAIERLEPDAVLLYEAHNEYFGAFGVASLQSMGRNPAAMELGWRVRRLELYQAFEALGAPAPAAASAGGARDANLIEVMAAVPEIAPADPLRERARGNLVENFRAVARAGRARGVPVVLSTVVSLERGLVPVVSFSGDLPDVRRGPFAAELERARERIEAFDAAAESGASNQLVAELRRLAEEAPRHAEARYWLARALEASERGAEATEAYRLARDLDAMPWRAERATNAALRALAAEERASLADAEASFAAGSANTRAPGATGWELFADHVHPSLEGQALLARTFAEALAGARIVAADAARLASLPEPRALAERLGVNALELYAATHIMATLFRAPPFSTRNGEVAARIDARLAEFRARAGAVERRALERWEEASRAAGFALPVSWFGAVAALEAGDAPRARQYAQVAQAAALPFSDERAAAALVECLAEIRSGSAPSAVGARLTGAVREARQAAALSPVPSPVLERALAGLLTLAGETDEGRRHEAGAAELAASAPAWQRAFFDSMPAPASLAPAAVPEAAAPR